MDKTRIKRFTAIQRLFHVFLMVAFLLQGATGLARLTVETPWGKWLTNLFGGYESARTIHVYIGIAMIVGFLLHVFYVLFNLNWKNFPKSLFRPDSIVPRPADIKQFFQHAGWFFGLCKAPDFDRWGYWEKFDYWAVFWGMIILGGTGLMLAYPIGSSSFMPGWGLNLAFWIHRIEAILAMAHIFIIHFFIAHLRPHNFPMDRAMFEGSVELEAANLERPGWITRLEREGELKKTLVPGARKGGRIVFYIFGYTAVAIGIFLLIGGLLNVPYVTW
jgi:cytochrome b subunit of formate dehydrogenase